MQVPLLDCYVQQLLPHHPPSTYLFILRHTPLTYPPLPAAQGWPTFLYTHPPPSPFSLDVQGYSTLPPLLTPFFPAVQGCATLSS